MNVKFNIAYITLIGLIIVIVVAYSTNEFNQIQPIEPSVKQASKSFEKKDYQEALLLINAVLDCNQNNTQALTLKANILIHTKKYNPAIETLEKLKKTDPDNYKLLTTLANLYQKTNQLVKSAKLYSAIIKSGKATSSTYYNFAWALSHLGLLNEAVPFYKKVLELNPNHPQAHYGLAEIYLAQGIFKEGWNEFEWRQQGRQDSRYFSEKMWNGIDSITNKRILIRCEYGLGDTIQFIRYTKNLKERGAYVIVEAQPNLVPLLSLSPHIDQVFSMFETLPKFDVQIRLMSLARIFSPKEGSIEQTTPYLYANHQLIKSWGKKLNNNKNIKIGIAWAGNRQYDNSLPPLSRRSINPTFLVPLIHTDNTSFYNLQINKDNQIGYVDCNIHEFDKTYDREHGPFMDTASVIMNMDLVITIDTSIAHLAGALGKPVWVMLPYRPDWRWQLNRNDTPWYPTMKLFRQTKPGNWSKIIDNIHKELVEFVCRRKKKL